MIYATTHRTPWYRYVMIVPVFASLFFTFSCQPDEEEIAQQAVAQSYEEVTDGIAKIDQEIQRTVTRYYPSQEEYRQAIDSYRSANSGQYPNEVQLLQGKAPSSTLEAIEKLVSRREELREKLAYLPDADGVYTVVANQPEPANGMKEFYQFIGNSMKYPVQARRMGIEGKVFVQFVVNKYGELTDIKTLKGIGAGCDEEAMRVVTEAPEWKPGTTADGQPVSVRLVLPITFKLGNGETTSHNEANADEQSVASEESQIDEMVVVGYQ